MSKIRGRHALFLDELYSDPTRNATEAWVRVFGVKRETARTSSKRCLDYPAVAAECARRDKEIAERAGLAAGDVLQLLVQVATADARDLIEYWRGPCRYCHGDGHLYQRTPREYREAWDAYQRTEKGRQDVVGMHFDHAGGLGFNRRVAPHPECPECNGDGEGYEIVRDTRNLSAQAARLYGGVKRTKDGISVITRGQDKALELLAKVHGLLRDKAEDPEDLAAPPAATVTYGVKDARKVEP